MRTARKLFSLVALTMLLVISNCSKVPENNDPILGTWTKSQTISTSNKSEVNVTEEWIFNDVYLGRYHRFEDGSAIIITDFSWSIEDDMYYITYPGIDKNDATVIYDDNNGIELLSTQPGGSVYARR
ncbi:hypothetical protein GCM10011414_21690 [Croceivirga lutea]|uniref:hypothetical protein n=1 Tax=Croceivirga lutea TaxID=1775167 RepID=UPI00163A2D2F|nr:hypothetical protein [Croceivirga lutea]GGG51733.1 hypothetical protein GCM10011414_21690 [Croceivirga lutea]